MASLERLTSKKTGRISYRVQIRLPGGVSESATFSNKKLAEAHIRKVETAIEEGKYFPQRKAARTAFAALVELYEQNALKDAKVKTRSTQRQHLKFWNRQFVSLTLAQITPDRIAEARDALAVETFTRGKPRTDEKTGMVLPPKQYARTGATVNRYLRTLSRVFSYAIRERHLLERNPVSSIDKKKEPRGRTRFLSDDERERLLRECGGPGWPPLRALVLLALTTGARRGELISLKWADIDTKTGRALVRESKNGEQRTLPLVGKALEALRELKLQGSARSEYVFRAPNGLDEPYVYFDAHWRAALKAAGLRDMRFHDLRHTTASMLAAQGASLLEIADVLGHKTLAMVKRYSHLVVDHKAKVIERLAAAKGL